MSHTVLDFLDKAKNCTRLEDLTKVLQQAIETLGFSRWAYQTQLPNQVFPLIVHSFPALWVEHYTAENYSSLDPVITKGGLQTAPFLWSALSNSEDKSRKQSAYLAEAADFGLTDGIGIPIPGLNGRNTILSMASDENENAINKQILQYQDQMIALGFAFHSFVIDLGQHSTSNPNPLSDREIHCLSLVIQGKTSRQIADITGITQRTVNFHIENAKRKLGALSRTHAAAEAVRKGFIAP